MSTKLPDLTSLSSLSDTDLVYVVDVSDMSDALDGSSKRVTLSDLSAYTTTKFCPRTSAESSAGVTPTNYRYEPGNVLRYGAVGDNSTDNSTALQTAINVASYSPSHKIVTIPAGRYRFNTALLFYYHATSNPNFSQDANSSGQIILQGEGPADYSAMVSSGVSKGSILNWAPSGGTGTGLLIGDGTLDTRGVILRDLSVIGTTTGLLARFNKVSRNCGMDNCFIWNNGAGDGISFDDCFLVRIKDVYVTRTSGQSGIGIRVHNPNQGAGIYDIEGCSARNFEFGIVIGDHTANGDAGMSNVRLSSNQSLDCDEGLTIGNGVRSCVVENHHSEASGVSGVRIFRGARNVTFVSPYFNNSAATEGDVVLGESGAADSVISHGQIRFIAPKHVNVNVAGYARYSSISCESVAIIQPEMTMRSGATATGISIADEQQHGLEIIRPVFTNTFTTEIANLPRVDLLVAGDTLGQRTHRADVLFYGDVGFYGTTPVSQQADISALTDNSGGTADNTIQAIGGTYSQSEVANNFADLTEQVNALRTVLRNYGLMA